ncbi:hypothetical protein [Vibrio parahaemolyticus]|uniref:hypothetical protein n=1 Tax=Vibrio parahaemolyticus TaxID=670 RepID=UPI001E4C8A88|nr:hypothetical protein [Vibrio parahaemolyticus]MCX4129520.1 hypothetical protein [Vibrio parahaemolyticus]MCX8905241.1 hypothetical protein [Vibrio parahaemolyticus]HBB9986364.1 hypothetical protein [Vibrio parahaemolyticus]HCE1923277.1 hypothetical protein [Vibrio parahaemolyticus]
MRKVHELFWYRKHDRILKRELARDMLYTKELDNALRKMINEINNHLKQTESVS